MKIKMVRVILVAVAAVVTIIAYVHHSHRQNGFHQDPIVVQTVPVKSGNIEILAKAVGTLTAAKNVQITPEFAGQVSAVLFQDGSFVKQNTPLIQLDDKVYKAKADSSKAALYFSQTNYDRMTLLGARGVVAKQAVESALADLKQKQADEEQSEVTLEKMRLVAPFDGVLTKSQISPGDYVTVGQALVSLTDIQHLRVEYSVSEKFLSQLKLGQEVRVTTSAYPGKEFSGKVTYISPTINIEDRTISLYADIPNDSQLLTAGLYVNVMQNLGMKNQVILVPPESLLPTIDGQKIYKVVNGKAESVAVDIGQRSADSVEIKSGLSPNDVIVVAGEEKLKDGMVVTVAPKV